MLDSDFEQETKKTADLLKNKYVQYAGIGLGGFILLLFFKIPLLMLMVGFATGFMYCKLKSKENK